MIHAISQIFHLEWVVRTLAVAGFLTICAHALAHTLQLFGRARRGVWGLTMLLTVLSPWLGEFITWHGPISNWVGARMLAELPSATLQFVPMLPNAPTPVQVHTPLPLKLWFALAWAVSSAFVLYSIIAVHHRMRRARTMWQRDWMAGRPVLVAEDVGPAVIGVRRPVIVVPRWVFQLSRAEQWLISRHESEHLYAGDVRLLMVGVLAIAVMPWNVLLWWQFRQLRACVETDCDERVLAGGVDRHDYGSLLLKTAARCTTAPALIPALGGRASLLERRILALSERPVRHRVARAVPLLAVAGIVGAAACDTMASAHAPLSLYYDVSELRAEQVKDTSVWTFVPSPVVTSAGKSVRLSTKPVKMVLKASAVLLGASTDDSPPVVLHPASDNDAKALDDVRNATETPAQRGAIGVFTADSTGKKHFVPLQDVTVNARDTHYIEDGRVVLVVGTPTNAAGTTYADTIGLIRGLGPDSNLFIVDGARARIGVGASLAR